MAGALPIYELLIDEAEDSKLQVSAIALVESPAIEKNWFAFNDNKKMLNFSTVDDEERIVVGPAMIPDMLIYRNDKDMGEYNVFFTAKTIKQIADKFYKKSFHGNSNIEHDPAQQVNGINFFMSFLRDTPRGLVGMAGDYPEGTWFLGGRVYDDATWQKIKSGEVKGFSAEGWFGYDLAQAAPVDAEQTLAQIKQLLSQFDL